MEPWSVLSISCIVACQRGDPLQNTLFQYLHKMTVTPAYSRIEVEADLGTSEGPGKDISDFIYTFS